MPKGIFFFLFLCLFFLNGIFPAFTQTAYEKKVYTAVRISSPPEINGVLDDSCWMNVAVAADFTQTEPNPGFPARQRTEVKLLYDNNAVYVGAMMYDTHPDSMLCELSKRENVFFGPNCEAFGMLIDTYRDGLNGSFLGVSLAGVQTDTRVADPEEFDDSWNAVWESKVTMNEKGWVAEIRIPYSALRFPKKPVQEWGINFSRMTRRYSEFSHWNPIHVEETGFIHQCGILKGIQDIESPLRLSFSPYVSAYLDNYDGNNSYSLNGGADVKYGINESFTMDMTLIPDFGQVKSDEKVLNLSPFEIRYDERRPFFTEGTEMFNKAGIFYSRRIGGEPMGFAAAADNTDSAEIVEKNMPLTRLYNATKISGRTSHKSGIGFFNAVTAPAYATLLDTLTGSRREIVTQPLSNYNVLVLDQGLRNNSYVSLINTSVMREGHVYDANVTGTQFKLATKENKYALLGGGAYSQQFFPDSASPHSGYRYEAALSKISGNYTAYFIRRIVTANYNPNDMGYQDRTNQMVHILNQNYNIFKSFWHINKVNNHVGIDLFHLYDSGQYTWFNVDGETTVDFKNYYTLGLLWLVQPLKNYDYYETHTKNRYYLYPRNYGGGIYLSSDQKDALRVYTKAGYRRFDQRSRSIIDATLEPRYRFNDKLNMTFSYGLEIKKDNTGFADLVNDTIIFGLRDMDTRTLSLEANYIFTNSMSLSLFARHYWTQVDYISYFAVDEHGLEASTFYNTENDINYNAFNIDLAFTWQFAPASEMSAVWKNSILTRGQALLTNYWEDLDATISSAQQNSFSIRILYYLDYQKLRKRK